MFQFSNELMEDVLYGNVDHLLVAVLFFPLSVAGSLFSCLLDLIR